MTHTRLRGLVAASAFATLALSVGTATAQSATPIQNLVEQNKELAVLDNSSLGDRVDLYSGSLGFDHKDISIPGNSELPVELSRTFVINDSEYDGPRLAFLTWKIDIPRISAVLASSAPWPGNRCSTNWVPPDGVASNNYPGTFFNATEYNYGFEVSLPGQGSTQMAKAQQGYGGYPTLPVNSRVTNAGTYFTCSTDAKNAGGTPVGEGFVAHLPNGTTYEFNFLTSSNANVLVKNFALLDRYEAILLATRATDRFGNTVNYVYDANAHLTRIYSNDNREINIVWSGNVIVTAYDGVIGAATTRVWNYEYSGGELSGVRLPNGSYWRYHLIDIFNGGVGSTGGGGTVDAPSGLHGVFSTNRVQHPIIVQPPSDQTYFETAALVSKTLSGPNISTMTWNYSYEEGFGSIQASGTGSCPTTLKYTQVVDPSNAYSRYYFDICSDYKQGQQFRSDDYSASGALLRTVENNFVQGPLNRNNVIFSRPRRDLNLARLESTKVTINGNTYTKTYSNFDTYERPQQVTHSNNFNGQTKTETSTYHYNTNYWVMGLPASAGAGGLVAQSIDYNPLGLPQHEYAFGLRTASNGYYADGNPQWQTDGLNRQTNFFDYYRGVPRRTQQPDSANWYATVNPTGTVASVTNPNSATFSYSYDALDRRTGINYPAIDGVASAVGISYVQLGVGELGMAVGTWRRRSVEGNTRISTYYDALQRPVLTEEIDTATSVSRYTRTQYDFLGRVSFQSYPSGSSSAVPGILFNYDALGRLYERRTTGIASNVLLETINYLSNNRKQVIDADGKSTTVTYQAFGEPDYSKAVKIEAPETQTTTIGRDVFGKITTITQSGTWAGSTLSAVRSFTYDSNQRPCRRIDPESGSTVWGYNAASEVTWEAKGQSGSGCLSSAPAGASSFAYNLMGRRTSQDYPGTVDDVTASYDPIGNVLTVNNSTAAWTYTYNLRDLAETEVAQIDGKTFTLNPTYNSKGQLTSLATPTRTLSYTPDAWGRATQIGTYVSGVQYTPSGLPGNYGLANGLSFNQTLDERLRPQVQSTVVTSSGIAVQRLAYSYTPGGDLSVMDDQVDDTNDMTASYDDLHRLKTANGLWGSATYAYDPLNNLRSRSGSTAFTYNYDGSNRLSTITGNQIRTYSYNLNGEITGDGTKTFTVNYFGQIQSISGVANYGYDGNAKRIKATQADGAIEYALYDHSGTLVYTLKIQGSGSAAARTAAPSPAQTSLAASGLTAPTNPQPGSSTSPGGTLNTTTPTLSWNTVDAATSYNVVVSGGTSLNLIVTGTSTPVSLNPGANHSWRVSACSEDAPCSAYSAIRYFATPAGTAAPVTPSGLNPGSATAPGPITASSTVTLAWTATSGATSYTLQVTNRNTGSAVVNASTGSTSYVASLTAGIPYSWTVKACNGTGCSTNAAVLYFVTPAAAVVPGIPTGLTPGSGSAPGPTTANNTVNLSWAATANASSYNVLVINRTSGATVVNTSTSNTSYLATLTANTPHSWTLQACSVAGCSATTSPLYFQTQQAAGTETKTDYLSLGGQTLVEISLTGTTTTTTYLHPDLLGSPRRATSQTGATLWQEHFDPYGKKLNGVNEKIGYTGHSYDPETQYTYAQARFYDAQVGRFLSNDPVHFTGDNPFTFNRYSYANNNPYRFTDPSGQIVETVWDVANVAMDVASLGSNLASGNLAGAALDAGGLLVDAAATVIPGVPGGAGAAIKASRVTAKQLRNTERSKFAASKAKALAENGGKCNYCGEAEATVGDHIDSLKSYADEVNAGTMTKTEAAQAAHGPENVAGACASCNADKSAKQLSSTPGEGKYVPPDPSPRIEERLNQ